MAWLRGWMGDSSWGRNDEGLVKAGHDEGCNWLLRLLGRSGLAVNRLRASGSGCVESTVARFHRDPAPCQCCSSFSLILPLQAGTAVGQQHRLPACGSLRSAPTAGHARIPLIRSLARPSTVLKGQGLRCTSCLSCAVGLGFTRGASRRPPVESRAPYRVRDQARASAERRMSWALGSSGG